jgi:hypothetical protein
MKTLGRFFRFTGIALTALIGLLFFVGTSSGQVQVIQELYHDVSRPLREIPPLPPKPGQTVAPPLGVPPGQIISYQADPVVQGFALNPGGPSVILNFKGIGNGIPNPNNAPIATIPDTNGAVGATQFVQSVNTSFAVFDKGTGNVDYGPADLSTLWSDFPGIYCHGGGDAIAQYDKLADRWVMANGGGHVICIAVSVGSDATGAYHRYLIPIPDGAIADYLKLGVWPDAYYISFDVVVPGGFLDGTAEACALDRTRMLLGKPATGQCFRVPYLHLLPSDLDGTTPPPLGSPNYFLNLDFGGTSLNMWKFYADFVTNTTTLVGPTSIPVAGFQPTCFAATPCAPQLGTATLIQALGDRLMYRLAYRNFGDHEALVVNHSVKTGAVIGVRWYQLGNLGGTPTVVQQSTYAPDIGAPDPKFRFMGSIAMDKAGDLAVGYSVSSSSIYPSIRYAGRVSSDPPGTLGAEQTIIDGTGYFCCGRWGDYTSMSVDPVDDCTFWYTNEYYQSGAFIQSTRIASFRFPNCLNFHGNFSLNAHPGSLVVCGGGPRLTRSWRQGSAASPTR